MWRRRSYSRYKMGNKNAIKINLIFVTVRWAMHLAHCVILAILRTMPSTARVEDMEWTDEEKAVLARAETLRTYGRRNEATNMVAAECVLPQNFYDRDVSRAGKLDVARWHAALTGERWNGTVDAFHKARAYAALRRRMPAPRRPNVPYRRDSGELKMPDFEDTLKMFRSSHLLVEPFSPGRQSIELADYTEHVRWPERHNAGRLEWDVPHAHEHTCCFCDALLFEAEEVKAVGTTLKCGKLCCSQG